MQRQAAPASHGLLLLTALLGLLLTLAQTAYILVQGDILCLNAGCAIVESLTRVPPLAFNLAGALYFAAILGCLRLSRQGSFFWPGLRQLLLTAGLAAEGALLGFQLYVSQAFCAYCLIIFATVLTLNVLAGWRQLLTGLTALAAVLVAMTSLQFRGVEQETLTLQQGSYAQLNHSAGGEQLYLFFSATCPHCEEVLASIGSDFTCRISFNPIDTPQHFAVPGAERNSQFAGKANRSFLKSLEIGEIPVLVSKKEGEVRVLQGKQRILAYLRPCQASSSPTGQSSLPAGVSSATGSGFSIPKYYGAEPDGCQLDQDCAPPAAKR